MTPRASEGGGNTTLLGTDKHKGRVAKEGFLMGDPFIISIGISRALVGM